MAKLPGELELGPAPQAAAARPVVDTSGAGAAIAQGSRALGEGVQQIGQGVGELALDEGRWEYAKAHAYAMTSLVNQDAATSADTNYGPDASGKGLTNRHADAVTKIQSDAAAMISSPGMRERFIAETMPTFQRSMLTADRHARGLENNANHAWVEQQGDRTIDLAVKAPDDDTRRALLDAQNGLYDGLVARGAMTPMQALEAKRNFAHRYATSDLLARADSDPQGVINELRAAPGSPDDITGRILKIEGTGRNPNSTADGTGQFTNDSWLSIVKQKRPDLAAGKSDAEILAMRADPKLGRDMTEANRADNQAYLTRKGIQATPGAQYLAHFLGPAGASAVLQADPNRPVADVLTDAVGKKTAQAMIDANPTVLNGKLAGSVKGWADSLMGGATPGQGSVYDYLRPDIRAQLLAHAEAAIQKRQVDDRAAFQARVQDATSEAMTTGAVTKPLTQADFIAHYGAIDGPRHFQAYDTTVQTGRAVASMTTMAPPDQDAVVESLRPKPGEPGFALKEKAFEIASKARNQVRTAIAKDPAGFAAEALPAASEAYKTFSQVAADPTANDEQRAAAARDYATKTLMEQQRVGVPTDAQRVVPKSYVDGITAAITKAGDSDDPQKRIGIVAQIQREAAMWGENWPAVMRDLAPNVSPLVRAIGAGADPTAMTRLLSLPKDEAKKPSLILQQQNDTKAKDLTTSLNDAFAPFRRTLVGRQLDRDFPGYFNLAQELGALYVRDGKSASDAATAAFNDLVGKRYDFRDTWRIPKSAGATADDVQAGTVDVRNEIRRAATATGAPAGTPAGLLEPGNIDVGARPSALNADGKVSTVRTIGVNIDGKETVIPTVSDDGKLLDNAAAIDLYRRTGKHLGKFETPDQATAYAKSLHEAQAARYTGIGAIQPALDDMGLGDKANRADSFGKFARDGVFVTAPDNSGLNLVYGDKAVRSADGKPLLFTWGDLAKRGSTPTARAETMRKATEFQPGQTP